MHEPDLSLEQELWKFLKENKILFGGIALFAVLSTGMMMTFIFGSEFFAWRESNEYATCKT